jgi:mannose-6-phosphate isomerase-like protein (cupin superfamily)
MSALRMPGSTLMSRLKVYNSLTPDGQHGGTPHVHLLCTEMYVTLAGSGAVEIIDANGFSRVDLQPNASLLFSPGTIHRLINLDGNLEILVMMQNSGLPERGDNVVCFPEAYLTTDAAYTDAMRVKVLEDAYRRRDRGVEGFLELKAAFDADAEAGRKALERFFELAEQRTAPFRDEWARIVQNGAQEAVNTTLNQLERLQAQDTGYLLQAQHQLIPTDEPTTLGFCGHLHRYFDPVTLMLEGIESP